MDSATVFELRKVAKELDADQKLEKLEQAFGIAKRLFYEGEWDEWNIKAYGWVLIDLCKVHLSLNNLDAAAGYFSRLSENTYADDIIENQVAYLRPKIDVNYSDVKKAEELSKANKHDEAFAVFRNLISNNKLREVHHDAYGWVIYRYIKGNLEDLTSIQVRTYLRDYMNLKNERPSMLHSMILNFALNYSKENSDFNLFNFFKLWDPKNLRDDDKSDQHYEGNNIPSLISRICRNLIESDIKIDIAFLKDRVDLESYGRGPSSEMMVLDLLRQPFFWKILKANKEERFSDVWKLLKDYNSLFSSFVGSKWHSEVLSLAERYMNEEEEWRFLEFFQQWKPENLLPTDWKEIEKDGKVYKSLALKCLRKAFGLIKSKDDFDLQWLIDIYEKAVLKHPSDEWLRREYALLLIKNNEIDKAIEIYKSLVLVMSEKAYIWHEFSSCFTSNNELKIGMLSKAIQLEKNEDFLGDIHLELAKTLIDVSMLENAAVELVTYRKHREKKEWKLSATYEKLYEKVCDLTSSLENNIELYHKYIPTAEEYAFENVEWQELVLYDVWRNKDNKERCSFGDAGGAYLNFGVNRFKLLRNAHKGKVYELKIHEDKKEIKPDPEANRWVRNPVKQYEYKFIPLLIRELNKEDWEILEDEIAVIDYINTDKKVIHAITTKNELVFYKGDVTLFNPGEFIRAKRLEKEVKGEKRIELKRIVKVDDSDAAGKFERKLAVVDNVNPDKELFHFVVDRRIHGIVRYRETQLRPKEGDVLELSLLRKNDSKRNKVTYKAILLEESNAMPPKLVRVVKDRLQLKYKSGAFTRDFYELSTEEISNLKPDFAFIADLYISGYALEKYGITENCEITVKGVFTGDKWKFVEFVK